MRAATFVSLLVHRRAIDRHQLPLKHYFLWSDDIEYTSRVVLGGERAWFVPSSVVLHDTAAPADFMSAVPDRFYYHARNTLLMAAAPQRPLRDRLLRLWMSLSTATRYVLRNPDRASVSAVIRAFGDALRKALNAGA
jgi:GT2 family glycosyltransferase